jgi:hypothetical protein
MHPHHVTNQNLHDDDDDDDDDDDNDDDDYDYDDYNHDDYNHDNDNYLNKLQREVLQNLWSDYTNNADQPTRHK